MKTKVLIVDDHDLFREALQSLIQRSPDIEVVGVAGNSSDALTKVREFSPDLVLMDVDLGATNGIEASRQILAEFPDTRILVLSATPDAQIVDEAIQAGVNGYQLKGNASVELLRAIHAIMNGHFYLCPEVSNPVIAAYRRALAARSAPPENRLSDRELEVLKLTAAGDRLKDIADKLGISVKTVESHRANLMRKLGCASTAELTRHAIREGISPM